MVDDPLPFKAAAFEIQDQTDRVAGDLEVIEHLPEIMIGDSFDDLGVHNDEVENNEIGDVFPHLHGFIQYVVAWLLLPWDAPEAELDAERVFIRLFQKTMTQGIENLERTVDDRAGFHLKSQSVFIRVHPWFKLSIPLCGL